MSEMSKSDGGVLNKSTCKEFIEKFYKLFHDYRYVYALIDSDRNVYVQLCNSVHKRGDLLALRLQYQNLYSFYCNLVSENRKNLLEMFDALYNEHGEIQSSLEVDVFESYLNTQVADECTIKICLAVGEFFIQYGLFHNANVFVSFAEYCVKNVDDVRLKLDIYEKLIYLDAVLHRFKKLSEICIAFGTVVSEREMKTEKYLRYLKTNRYNNSQEELEAAIRLASLYSNYSFLHFSRSRYDLAYRYAISAVKNLKSLEDIRATLLVCRHASKALVANQYYIKAKFFIDEAMGRATMLYIYDEKNSSFVEVLVDYAYFLKKFGNYEDSQAIYEEALKMYRGVFGSCANMHIALVQKDLAETLLERGTDNNYALSLIENAILCMEEFLTSEDNRKNTTLVVEAYLIKALLLIKVFKKDDPKDRKTRKLHELKIQLERREKTVALYCGATSSLYTKYLIVLIKMYFTTGNDDYALMKSRTLMDKAPGYFSTGRNLHEPIARAEMASTIIHSCNIEDYRDHIIRATHALEESVAIIEKNVSEDSCRELEKYYETLKYAHKKIVKHEPDELDPVPFENKYHIYEILLIYWRQNWQSNYNDDFTKIRSIISDVPKVIAQVNDMDAVL